MAPQIHGDAERDREHDIAHPGEFALTWPEHADERDFGGARHEIAHERHEHAVGHDARQAQAARIGEVARLPPGIELLLERTQALEAVDRLAVFVEKRAEPEQRLHHALGRMHRVAHQVERQLAVIAAQPDVAERHHLPVALHHRHRKTPQIGLVEEPEREALLRPRLVPQPVVGHGAQLRQQGWHLRHGRHAKDGAVFLQAARGLTQLGGAPALERERGQVNLGLFAELNEREAEVGVGVHVRRADFVEHRHPAEVVAAFEEGADEPRHRRVGTDRIAHGHPGAALHAVHQERVAGLVEEQRLVAQEDEVGRRASLLLHRRFGRPEVGGTRRRHHVRGVPQQPGHAHQQHHHRGAHAGAQKPRGLAVQFELPPELVGIVHVLEGKQAEPKRRSQSARQRRQPAGREARIEERGPPVEGRAGPAQCKQHEQQQRGLFVVEALEERRRHAHHDERRREVVGGVEPASEALRQHEQAPAMLPTKCDTSTTLRGTIRPITSRRPGEAGVAPDQSSTLPEKNDTAANTRGVNSSVTAPSHAPALTTWARRSRASSTTSASSARANGSR